MPGPLTTKNHPPARLRSVVLHSALLPIVLFLGGLAPLPLQPTTQEGTKVILLGTGTPNATPDRSGPATAIVVNGTPYIIDFGPGVVRRAAAAGLKPADLRVAFLTHLHSDHTIGYPDLILSGWTLERDVPLEVYGPPGLQAMSEHILKAYEQDIDLRLNGLEPANPEGYKVNAHEVEPGVIYRDDKVTVTAFPVPHGSWKHAYGYRFETSDRTIVLSGDTTASAEIVKQAKGADVLVHEVYSVAGWEQRTPEWKRYHAAFHTSSVDLGKIAAEAQPKLLLLTHILFMGQSEQQLRKEIREHFDGPVIVGKDLGVY